MIGFKVQIREAFVIAQYHVETRPMPFDQVVFEQQRLGVRVGDRHFHIGGLGDQSLHFGLHIARLKIRCDAALEVARLADVENLPVAIEHPVNTWAARKAVDEHLGVELFGNGAHDAPRLGSARSRAFSTIASNISVVSRRVWVL